jgi:hypothetical protein
MTAGGSASSRATQLEAYPGGEYNHIVSNTDNLPQLDRLSVIIATSLLAYASAAFIDLPGWSWATQLPGIYLEIQVNTDSIIAVLVAALTATGTYWTLQAHPLIDTGQIAQHLILPALTAWVIAIPLSTLPLSPLWWSVFGLGGLLLLLVLTAEYIVVDPRDLRHPLATATLTAVSFALFLILVVSLRSRGVRLFLLLPALAPSIGAVSLRTLNLRIGGRWPFLQAIVVALIISHLAAALHYWPLSPTTYGLALLSPAYALTSLFANLSEGRSLTGAILGPALVLLILISTAIWLP